MMTRLRPMLVLAVLAGLWVGAHAQQKPSAQPVRPAEREAGAAAQPDPTLQARHPRYALRPGDEIELIFRFAPEFNQTITIQPDGYISLPEIGDMRAQGETVPELTSKLEQAYAGILRQPEVAVVLRDFEKPHFVVAGEVTRPGKYELRADTTATEAVAIAGGFNGRARHSQALLFRRVSEEWVEVKEVNLKRLYGGDYREDIALRPGDMLFVPQNRISKITRFLPRSSVGTYFNPADLF